MHPEARTADVLPRFDEALARHGLAPLARGTVRVLQVNVGKRCNQACHHCHVDAGPRRTEQMNARTAERVLRLLAASPGVDTLDVTGGAPELCPEFRRLVRGARALGRRVIDRCNLTVLFEPGQEDTARFLAEERVGVVASLPCYSAENVDRQRGRGVFERSIEALRELNRLGYANGDPALTLDLVYNPQGAALPPEQSALEARYRDELDRGFGIRFDRLLALANMPISRFADQLVRSGEHDAYMALLVAHFNPAAAQGVMCRTLVSVGWDGELYDCDFNQMVGLPLGGKRRTIWDVERLDAITGDAIATAPHCFGCTAGAGSSCGGALA
jgi:radical SAM/Cys-rich protein